MLAGRGSHSSKDARSASEQGLAAILVRVSDAVGTTVGFGVTGTFAPPPDGTLDYPALGLGQLPADVP